MMRTDSQFTEGSARFIPARVWKVRPSIFNPERTPQFGKMEMKKFGKTSKEILSIGQEFFKHNQEYLAESKRHAALYLAQPARTRCKLCHFQLPERPNFVKQSVPYVFCEHCKHLNGMHEDTDVFCQELYLDPKYAEYYSSKDAHAYAQRVKAIYAPKAEFLRDALLELGHDFRQLAHTDLGAGSGYYIEALVKAGCPNVQGLEASPAQVTFANRMLGRPLVQWLDLKQTVSAVEATEAQVLSMIGVLEHLQQPREVLRAIAANHNVKFLFLVLPLFSFCVFLEMAFPHVYPRHLVSDHTHLFTKQSVEWMTQEFAMSIRSEWWFGSDMLDLYRAVSCTLKADSGTSGMAGHWSSVMVESLDNIQLELDRKHLCSEVHLVLEILR